MEHFIFLIGLIICILFLYIIKRKIDNLEKKDKAFMDIIDSFKAHIHDLEDELERNHVSTYIRSYKKKE